MNPDYITTLAAADREFEHTTAEGWVLRCRLPDQIEMRRAARGAAGEGPGAGFSVGEQLTLRGVISWQNVKLGDVLPAGMAGIDMKAEAPCTQAMVRALLGDRTATFDALQEDFLNRLTARTNQLETDRKNSASA